MFQSPSKMLACRRELSRTKCSSSPGDCAVQAEVALTQATPTQVWRLGTGGNRHESCFNAALGGVPVGGAGEELPCVDPSAGEKSGNKDEM